ncbi:hypothetical protein EDF42_1866 [Curtobacterium sp. PhB172]|uniref:hypothetical protein n=1 Tax=Curtobacterium sp. PhB172 TaxID=2485196 RepID=UPI000FB0F05A|nr:hypothetical protein [Curtobacterium sp. PhB172]ROS65442.1 hypothetical protein EDF42_1866 [Curtobacterium sp. PhB172]
MWATRGRNWGFRFLYTGGLPDPLDVYEAAFAGTEDTIDAFRKRGMTVAVRFADPEGRRDRAGRVIPHEFVIFAPDAARFDTAEEARATLWDAVAEQYAAIWDQPSAPS